MKTKISTFILSMLVAACTSDMATVEYAQQQNDNGIHAVAKSTKRPITLSNNANNTTLYINNCYIGNSIIYNDYPLVLDYGKVINLCDIDMINMPDTIILDGEIKSNNISIYKGLMYVPFDTVIELRPDNDWKDVNGNGILHSIKFNVEVNDWKR